MAWNPFGVQFELSASSGGVTRTSATQYTVKINAAWETYYDGAQTNSGMTASSGGGSVTLNPFGTYASSGSGSFTGTYSISGNGSATKTITVTFKNFNNDNGDSATSTVSFNVTVPAWTSYTVSYNANGGTGAPSSQTKWKDQTLTLSSTKPTRTGYTFLGWSTSSSATSATYSAGGSYTANSAATLYAVWSENKLTINYYSNYATSAFDDALNTVSASTNVIVYTQYIYYDNDYSTYGLANYSNSTGSVYMQRIGYTGTGNWGTSTDGGILINENTGYATGQTIAEALGKDLSSGNASINLYAQWQKNTYTFLYNANSNAATGTMDTIIVEWGETFILPENAFKREGYKFIGWNVCRNADSTWYVAGQSWITEDAILEGGYEKKLYQSQEEHVFGNSWVKGDEYTISDYTMYALWEISGVIYIDNGTTLEPYLAYIDNGIDWDLYLAYVDNGTDWIIIS